MSEQAGETSHVYESRGQVLAGVADRLRGLRGSRGMDRADLAYRSGVSEDDVESIEDGRWTPTLRVLGCLASGLDVALAELCTDTKPGPAAEVTRGSEVAATEAEGMSVQVLTPRSVAPGLYAARYRIAAGTEGVRPAWHDGHDWLYVLAGRLTVQFDQEAMTLAAGDSVSFSARLPHRLSVPGEQDAEFLAVGATPF